MKIKAIIIFNILIHIFVNQVNKINVTIILRLVLILIINFLYLY